MHHSIFDIQRLVADYYRLRVTVIHGPARFRRVVRCRHIAMLLAREFTEASYPDIGLAFGGRDHTTVISGVKSIRRKMAADPKLQEEVDALRIVLIGAEEPVVEADETSVVEADVIPLRPTLRLVEN